MMNVAIIVITSTIAGLITNKQLRARSEDPYTVELRVMAVMLSVMLLTSILLLGIT